MTTFDPRWKPHTPKPKRLLAYKPRTGVREDFNSSPSTVLSDSSLLMTHARSQLERLREVNALGRSHDDLAHWTLNLLQQIATKSTVYPAIAPDYSGGLGLHWVANHLSLEIEVDSEMSYSYVAYNHDEIIVSGEGKGLPPATEIRNYLTLLTRYVEVKNPHWREHFA